MLRCTSKQWVTANVTIAIISTSIAGFAGGILAYIGMLYVARHYVRVDGL